MNKSVVTTVLPCSDQASFAAIALLRKNEAVSVPTETVYGLAADARSVKAIGRIYSAKDRPASNPLIVHVGREFRDVGALENKGLVSATDITPEARRVANRLMDAFWPGPLTIVLPRGENLPAAVAGGLATVGFRMPAHDGFLSLLDGSGMPLAAPSANRSCRISPTTAEHVLQELDGRIPLILDGGPAEIGVESTIVSVGETGELKLLRPGGVPIEDIEAAVDVKVLTSSRQADRLIAPGMAREHYAPSRPLLLARRGGSENLQKQLEALRHPKNLGVILLSDCSDGFRSWDLVDVVPAVTTISLDDNGDGRKAAAALFGALRALDDARVDAIIAEFPEATDRGLWPAVGDRLTRAAAKWSKCAPVWTQ